MLSLELLFAVSKQSAVDNMLVIVGDFEIFVYDHQHGPLRRLPWDGRTDYQLVPLVGRLVGALTCSRPRVVGPTIPRPTIIGPTFSRID